MKAVIKEIYTQTEDGKGIYKIDSYGKEDTVEYTIPNAYIGMELEVEYADSGISSITPTGKSQGIANFLTDYVKGIGPQKTAAVTWDIFREIKKNNIPAIAQMLSVKEEKAKEIAKICTDNKEILDLYILTNGVCTRTKIEKIHDTYQNRSAGILRTNPYKLTELAGIGFLEADRIACSTGIAKNSIERISAAMSYILFNSAYQEGHCYLTETQMKERMNDALSITVKQAGTAKERACENALSSWNSKREGFIKKYKPSPEEIDCMDAVFSQRKSVENIFPKAVKYGTENHVFVLENGRYYLPAIYEKEMSCAEIIAKELSSPLTVTFTDTEIQAAISEVEKRKSSILSKEGKLRFEATDEQKNAVYLALSHKICVISGGPGRGKTAIAEIIAQAYKNKIGNDSVIMMAPTGRAAQRITESTGYAASTVHRAISKKQPENKLIIVDESSMVDIILFGNFLKWAKGNTIVFLGDVDQIASIGPGQVLRNLMDSGVVPSVKLIQGHRNSGAIAKNSEKINDGAPLFTYQMDESFKYFPATRETITKSFLHHFYEEVSRFGIKNVMAITPSKRGMVGVGMLNNKIQEHYFGKTPGIEISPELTLHVGDRVMQTKNNADMILITPEKEQIKGVFNGEHGTVTKIIPDGENAGVVVTFDDGKKGGYKKETAKQLSLSYVMTIHKCQGSEAECVIMGMTFQDAFLINRNLFYTGETRAKKKIVLIGEQKKAKYGNRMTSAFDMAVYKTNDEDRQTTLAEKIRKQLPKTA